MAKYQQYQEYKDSGVEWLGQVPSEWSVSPLKLYLNTRKGVAFKSADFTDIGIRVVKASDIKDKTIRQSEVFLPSSFSEIYPKSVLKEGEVIISTVGSTPDVKNSAVGQIGILPFELDGSLLNQNTVVLSPKNNVLSNLFLFYLIQTDVYREHLDLNAHGTANQASLNISDILNFTFARPTIQGQAQIANFLDHETAQIDTLIEKQQTLIQLLKEKRQAVISRAVTTGLNPDAPMKDSGVEWLGEVPEHWEVKRVRHAFDIDNNLRTPINRQARSEMEGDFRYYGPTGVLNLINRYNVEGQYFLLGEDGDHFLKFEEKPMTIYVEGKFNVNNHAHLIKGKGKCSTKWGCLYFEHKDLFPWLIKQGVGRYKLQKTVLLDIPVAIPPLDEQEFILNAVNKKKNDFSEIEKRTEALINFLKERRTALISAAVTGKIDVRGWVAPDNK